MRFEWDENKNRQNLLKHDIRFETAALVFDDPYSLARPDESCTEEERWTALGAVGGAVLVVVYTWREDSVRMISARRATAHERKRYEDNR